MKVLFVCLGNICRSPLAEAIANKIAKEQNLEFVFDSAGTSSYHKGEAPCDNSQKIAIINNIDMSSYKSRPITKKDIEYFDVVVAMDEKNVRDMKSFGFKNIVKIGNFCRNERFKSLDVPDPYFYPGFEGFELIFEMIEDGVERLLTNI